MKVDRLRENRDQQRLGQAGHALKQQVAAREKCDQQPLDHHVLADDHCPDALAHRADEFERLCGNQARAVIDALAVFSGFCGLVIHEDFPSAGYSTVTESIKVRLRAVSIPYYWGGCKFMQVFSLHSLGVRCICEDGLFLSLRGVRVGARRHAFDFPHDDSSVSQTGCEQRARPQSEGGK